MNAERIQKAEKLVAEGKKHLSTGLFKWKPDVDSAIECFDKGKLIFFIFFSFRTKNVLQSVLS